MGQTTAMASVSFPLFIAYRCSKCGKLNAYKVLIFEKGSASYGGLAFGERKREGLKNEALTYANNAMKFRLAKIFEEAKERKFRAAGLKCKCSKCGNKEAWSKMRFLRAEMPILSLMVFPVFVSIMALIFGEFIIFGSILGGCVLTISLWGLFKKLRLDALEKHISELSDDSIPIIAITESDLYEKLNSKYGKTLVIPDNNVKE